METEMTIVTTFLVLILYFIPTAVGYINKKRNAGAILLLNLLLGWTILGWIGALIWATCKDKGE